MLFEMRVTHGISATPCYTPPTYSACAQCIRQVHCAVVCQQVRMNWQAAIECVGFYILQLCTCQVRIPSARSRSLKTACAIKGIDDCGRVAVCGGKPALSRIEALNNSTQQITPPPLPPPLPPPAPLSIAGTNTRQLLL